MRGLTRRISEITCIPESLHAFRKGANVVVAFMMKRVLCLPVPSVLGEDKRFILNRKIPPPVRVSSIQTTSVTHCLGVWRTLDYLTRIAQPGGRVRVAMWVMVYDSTNTQQFLTAWAEKASARRWSYFLSRFNKAGMTRGYDRQRDCRG